jgi:hypothetical protein
MLLASCFSVTVAIRITPALLLPRAPRAHVKRSTTQQSGAGFGFIGMLSRRRRDGTFPEGINTEHR